MAYDVIVVGARVAGAATAMLLARAGLRVLAVDRAGFPSDTVSSHQVHVPAVARLARWGLLDRLVAAGTPPTREVCFDAGTVAFTGRFPAHDGVDALYSPRRTLLDAVLVDAARAAGAEVRERFRVEELVRSDGAVVGIRGRCGVAATSVTERAPLVIGADGKRSFVAASVGARVRRSAPVRTFASYGYWSGVPLAAGEMYHRPGRVVAAFPTNDDLTMVYVAAPLAEFEAARRDLAAHHLRSLDRCGDLGSRVRGAVRVERLRTTPDQPNAVRAAHGPGWALAGDAGAVLDSVTAQGISHALADAESLAAAVVAGLGGTVSLAVALAGHERERDRRLLPMYDLTLRLAELRPRRTDHALFAALADRPAEIERFLGALAGVVPADQFFTPRVVLRLLAAAGLDRLRG
ncbi:NAD(P)/FAD-dependent oxidoreductase [Jiangella mangrovi]|uniref:2-polyprenyl-6-methoxyphenol hydroxylase-like FAD-dependent oxidoreductase n=1 Tax=Jiangella mangrovi TaxID=1524084 RepID=A0A7W9GMD6_9ACTN|nr:NAD(P)/FAD-dependent oxidoreductase [Jiangella mangrovi]MBB5786528.1 2-polyprenyl-6-methoxyphenol hydroxylase-like FAD-dependent oxidoreductase [Jiangella mangrovi]